MEVIKKSRRSYTLVIKGNLAGYKVDMIIIQGSTSQHGSVRVKSGGSDGRRTIVMEEASVRLEC